jgi:hypothetical protein
MVGRFSFVAFRLSTVITSVNITFKTTNGHRFELIFLIILVVYKVRRKINSATLFLFRSNFSFYKFLDFILV